METKPFLKLLLPLFLYILFPSNTIDKYPIKQISLESSLLPYEAGHFSLILALMTLHHVVNVKQTLIEFHRILKSDGILVIREHDCNSESFSLYLDIIHGFHAKVN